MTTGRRDRKKIETRRALAAAALRLTLEHGPDGVTIEQISDAADVSPRTFFNYFSSKEEAILGANPERRAALQADLAARPATESPGFAALRATLMAHTIAYADEAEEWAHHARLAREYPALFRTHVASFADFERGLIEIIADRLGLDADRDLYPSLVVTTALTTMRIVLDHWQANRPDEPLSDLLDEAFETLAFGLAPPLGAGPLGALR